MSSKLIQQPCRLIEFLLLSSSSELRRLARVTAARHASAGAVLRRILSSLRHELVERVGGDIALLELEWHPSRDLKMCDMQFTARTLLRRIAEC